MYNIIDEELVEIEGIEYSKATLEQIVQKMNDIAFEKDDEEYRDLCSNVPLGFFLESCKHCYRFVGYAEKDGVNFIPFTEINPNIVCNCVRQDTYKL